MAERKCPTTAKVAAMIAAAISGLGGGPAFPVGALYLNITGVNPGTELGYGTWTQVAQGRVIVGQDSSDADFDTAEETCGAKTHTHDAHATTANIKLGGAEVVFANVAAASHASASNVPPSYVAYVWKRTE